MLNKSYFNFLLLVLFTYRTKHLAIFFLSIVIISIVSSVFFIASSLKNDLQLTLDAQADFVLQRYEAGNLRNTPQKWVEEFLEIDGVSSAVGRVYGTHYYEPNQEHFLIVGIDFFNPHSERILKELFPDLDVAKFLEKKNMIIGQGVKELFDYYHYFKYYTFRPPDRSKEKVYIYDTFAKQSSSISNDMIIMEKDLAKKILGIPKDYVTDITLDVANPLEIQTIKIKLILSHFNMRIIEKQDIKRYYENLFNYKGGLFLSLYIVVFLTFFLILYQRYSMINDIDKKEIALLRTVGWRINEVITLKVVENFIVAIFAYVFGIILAYIYVYIFNAPLLREIFLGYKNLNNTIEFIPSLDFSILGFIFLLFIVPFILSIIIPIWKLCIIEPYEVTR